MQRLFETRQVELQIVKLGNGLQGSGHRNLKTTGRKVKRRNLHAGDSARQRCEVFRRQFSMIFGCGHGE
ncbi:hypothetical protein M8494_07695 [Serratia ureilytica]